jgi:hypothetical protein
MVNGDYDNRDNPDAEAFDSVTGLATTGGPSGAGITGKTIAGPDLTDDVVGNPIDADYMADQRTNVPGDETDTATGFAGEGGANPDADLPPRAR